jgi:hypothetical protein
MRKHVEGDPGVINAKLRQKQKRLLRRLKTVGIAHSRRAALRSCSINDCGRNKCTVVCAFGSRRTVLGTTKRVKTLFGPLSAPVFKAYVQRSSWLRPLGELHSIKINSIRKLVRGCLDKSLDPGVVAIGMVNVALSKHPMPHWKIGVSFIVSGVTGRDLDNFFSTRRTSVENLIHIESWDGQDKVSDVFRLRLPSGAQANCVAVQDWPNDATAEFYNWALGRSSDDLAFRYGCSRQLKVLKKKPRVRKPPKAQKRRRLPDALRKYQFGSDFREEFDYRRNRERYEKWSRF